MEEIKKRFEKLGIGIPDILIPAERIDAEKWAVVACDQYTSEPDYWKAVEDHVGDEPSTLRLIFPEVYLQKPGKEKRIEAINRTMEHYSEKGYLRNLESSFIFLRRHFEIGSSRKGLILALDLEKYSYEQGAKSLIRATEGTILERLPPRIAIRRHAPLELPHIMVLIDDRENRLFSYLESNERSFEKVYETPLMMHGGSIEGRKINSPAALEQIAEIFERIALAGGTSGGSGSGGEQFLFAMGDGNHSLATAKSIWEELKTGDADMEHPARWALVEIVNIYDEGLLFEPIHRLVFNMNVEELEQFAAKDRSCRIARMDSFQKAAGMLAEDSSAGLQAAAVCGDSAALLTFTDEDYSLAAAALDSFLTKLTEAVPKEIDFIHGVKTAQELTKGGKNTAFILPEFRKEQLFPAVLKDGALPRKTFSMGEPREKRYYFEARRIRRI